MPARVLLRESNQRGKAEVERWWHRKVVALDPSSHSTSTCTAEKLGAAHLDGGGIDEEAPRELVHNEEDAVG
jgi:hypothetical protein